MSQKLWLGRRCRHEFRTLRTERTHTHIIKWVPRDAKILGAAFIFGEYSLHTYDMSTFGRHHHQIITIFVTTFLSNYIVEHLEKLQLHRVLYFYFWRKNNRKWELLWNSTITYRGTKVKNVISNFKKRKIKVEFNAPKLQERILFNSSFFNLGFSQSYCRFMRHWSKDFRKNMWSRVCM